MIMTRISFFISRTMRNFCWEQIFYWTSRKFFWDPRSGLTRQIFRIVRKYFTLFHTSFSKNRQKLLSAAVESFLSVGWCSKLYQTFPWTLRNIFHMNYATKKCVDNFLRTENKAQQSSKRLFLSYIFEVSDYHFLKIDKNCSLLPQNPFYVSCDALSYTKSFLGP